MLCTRLLVAFSLVPYAHSVPVSLAFLREAVLTNVDIALTEIQEDIDQGTNKAIIVEDLARKWAAIGRLVQQAEQRLAQVGALGEGRRAVFQPHVFARTSGIREGSMRTSLSNNDEVVGKIIGNKTSTTLKPKLLQAPSDARNRS